MCVSLCAHTMSVHCSIEQGGEHSLPFPCFQPSSLPLVYFLISEMPSRECACELVPKFLLGLCYRSMEAGVGVWLVPVRSTQSVELILGPVLAARRPFLGLELLQQVESKMEKLGSSFL